MVHVIVVNRFYENDIPRPNKKDVGMCSSLTL